MYKATPREIRILAKDLKQTADIFSDYICNLLNFCLNEGKLPNVLKQSKCLNLNLKCPSTLSWWRPLSCRNQSIDLLCKSLDWFLYDNGLLHESKKRLKTIQAEILPIIARIFKKFLSNQVTLFMLESFSKCQCSFQKSYIAQEFLLTKSEKMETGSWQWSGISSTNKRSSLESF